MKSIKLSSLILSFILSCNLAHSAQDTIDVLIRADLGFLNCNSKGEKCQSTPYSGENTVITLKKLSTGFERWYGDWKGSIDALGNPVKGQIELFVESSPGGLTFILQTTVNGAVYKTWLKNLNEMKHTEIRGPVITKGDRLIIPFFYLSKPL